MRQNKEQILKEYFGYDHFRPMQAQIIEHVLAGQDGLVLMPTGGGKSLCYQVPALLMPGLTLVISPLIALMKDQVEALKANGIPAACLNSELSVAEQEALMWQIRQRQLKLLYIAPERLFSGQTFQLLREWNISLFAIDESHCISSWGHDFRPEYRQLNLLKTVFPKIPVVALTATADRVTRRDILVQLGIPAAPVFLSGFDRPNLSLTVLPGLKRLQQIIRFIRQRPAQPGIIYCLSRKNTETVAAGLQQAGLRAGFYHAGMEAAKRSAIQDQFLRDDLQVMVATVAFGMGIDKSNVRWVIHYNLPSNVESYYQEIGRAGRDGEKADTLLFYSYSDILSRQEMISRSAQPEEQKTLALAKLDRMKQYAQAAICRRRVLLSYFNEETSADCDNCDVCRNPPSLFDGTVIAQKALSAIARTGQKVAMGMLVDILRGNRPQQLLASGFDRLPTFGVGRDLPPDEWTDYISQLLNSGAMDIAYDDGHSFRLNNRSLRILKQGEKVTLVKFIPLRERRALAETRQKEKPAEELQKEALFERLRILRKKLSDVLNIPPYTVFSDASLAEMVRRKPVSEAQMRAVPGVGEEKYRRYGVAFINEIIAFTRADSPAAPLPEKRSTYLDTLVLYKEGYSVREIAEKRKLAPGAVLTHLVKLKEQGHPVLLQPLLPETDRAAIAEGIRETGWKPGDAVRKLFDHFNGAYDYGQLYVALALESGE